MSLYSDDDDRRLFYLFGSNYDPELANEILRIKRNDAEVTSLYLGSIDHLSEIAWRRLGHIIGQNTHLEELTIYTSTDLLFNGF